MSYATRLCTFRRKHRKYLVLLEGCFILHAATSKPQHCEVNCYVLLLSEVYESVNVVLLCPNDKA